MKELFRVTAIERDVDALGTPLAGLSYSRTIRIRARRDNVRNSVTPAFFFATEEPISAIQARKPLWTSTKHSYRTPTLSRT